jgi:hypothetical protein
LSSDEEEEEESKAAMDATKTGYQEKFKFHLGLNSQPNDFMWGWDSSTKFEGTFVGHTFAFRLAADPDVLVQTYTLQPTRIPDCPNLKNKAQVNRVTSVGLAQALVLPTGTENATDTIMIWNINGTRTHHRRDMAVPFSSGETVASAVIVSF